MIGHKITRFDTLESTNNFVAKLLEEGLYTTGEVILARFQTRGRGQRGSTWQSMPGNNLMFSFAIPSNFLDIHEHFILSKAVSVAIFELLSENFQFDVFIKWPNDILVDNQKICGILLETKAVQSQRYTVVGIGLNVNQKEFDAGYKATSISLQMGREMNVEGVLKELLQKINSYITPISNGFFDEVMHKYNQALYGHSNWIEFSEGHRTYFGQIKQVDNEGVILVKSKQGYTRSYRAKEVKIAY